MTETNLKLLPKDQYRGVNHEDPIRYYYVPVIGGLYKKRVEMCLSECTGGERVLEIGFGTGLSFLNLHDMYGEIHGLDLTADIDAVKSVFDGVGVQTYLRQGNVLEMPYPDQYFDTVLLISILEHLKPDDQEKAFREIARVLKPGGQVVYGVPVERPFMVFMFRMMGVDIRTHHYSTEKDVFSAARNIFNKGGATDLMPFGGLLGSVYQVGSFKKKP
jgi:ubiquinone/menaquinone biosynthesis C-methylase UbiE